jgi:hypothetical protein
MHKEFSAEYVPLHFRRLDYYRVDFPIDGGEDTRVRSTRTDVHSMLLDEHQ